MKRNRNRTKKTCFLLIVLLAVLWNGSGSSLSPDQPEQTNLLSGLTSLERLDEVILSADEWHPFPKASEQVAWRKLPEPERS